jgi:hypothetical protein
MQGCIMMHACVACWVHQDFAGMCVHFTRGFDVSYMAALGLGQWSAVEALGHVWLCGC